MAKLKRTEDNRERIYCCVGVGDCKAALKGKFSAPIAEAACPFYDHGPQFEGYYARGKFSIARALLNEKIQPSEGLAELLYQCTLCGACHEVCNNCENPDWSVPAREGIGDHVEIWEGLRADLVDAGVAPLPRHKQILKELKEKHNPYSEAHGKRSNWLPKDITLQSEGAETLFFVGCTGAYRLTEMPLNFVKVAVKSNIPILISPEEWCCGSVAFRTGDENLGKELAQHNSDLFHEQGIKTIVAACSGCYRTLKIDYPKMVEDWDFEVLSAIELVDKWIKDKTIKIKKKLDLKVTYHDPCHLGRHSRVFEPPRDVLKAIISDSGKFTEMRRNKAYAYCCGAGGGVKSGFPEMALEIAQDRIKEAEETGSEYLVTTCPFCLTNLRDAAKSLNSKIKVIDELELVHKAL